MKSRPRTAPASGRPQHAGNSWWISFAKCILGAALVAGLIWSGQIDFNFIAGLTDSPWIVLMAFVLTTSTWPLAAFRWKLILNALGTKTPYRDLFHIFGISMVFNLFVLGTLGGDAARIFYVARLNSGQTGRAIASVIADRAIGMLALISIATFMAIVNSDLVARVRPLFIFITALAVGLAMTMVFWIAVMLAPNIGGAILKSAAPWPKLAALISRVLTIGVMFRDNPAIVISTFVLSLLIQGLAICSAAAVAMTLNVGQLSLSQYLFTIPMTFIINAIPLTPLGIGVGEIAFDQLCRWLDPSPQAFSYSSIFFSYRTIAIASALAGLASFTLYKTTIRSNSNL